MYIWDKIPDSSRSLPVPNPVIIPKWLYDQAKAHGFNMDNYVIQAMIPLLKDQNG